MSTVREPEDRSVALGGADSASIARDHLIVEDLLLLLFQPSSHTIAGENTLFYVLGGAALADLAFSERVIATPRLLSTTLETVGAAGPADPILMPAWSYVLEKPRDVQTVIAAIGPPLRQRVLERLLERGDLREEAHRAFGIFPTSRLALGSGRRGELIASVRAALVDGEDPDSRTAAMIALLSASGALPQLHPEIPWGSDLATRSKGLEYRDWGATAAGIAVARTLSAVVSSAVIVASVSPRP